jgi:SAM-dependent methyltransferase
MGSFQLSTQMFGAALSREFLVWAFQGIGPGIAILGRLSGATVIEVGCGSGHNLAHLVSCHGASGIGVDDDPAKTSRAFARYGHLPGIRFAQADARSFLNATEPELSTQRLSGPAPSC